MRSGEPCAAKTKRLVAELQTRQGEGARRLTADLKVLGLGPREDAN